MAAYAYNFALDQGRGPIRFHGSRRGLLSGDINIGNYNQTLAEITAITRYFRRIERVILNAGSNGFIARWDATAKSIKIYAPTQETNVNANRAGAEAANDTNAGTFDFYAVGVMR